MMPRSMNEIPRKLIAVCNDDGIDAPGMWMLVEAVAALGDIVVVAPAREHSWAGRAHRSDTPELAGPGRVVTVESRPFAVPVPHGIGCFAVGGSPAICAAIACELDPRPDLFVSGMNDGYNAGSLMTASGTVGAAWEAAAAGITAIAFSTDNKKTTTGSRDLFVEHMRRISQRVLEHGLPHGASVLNVNIPPDTASGSIPVVTVTCGTSLRRQCVTWEGSAIRLEAIPQAGSEAGSDREALERGQISCTFLQSRIGVEAPDWFT